MSVTLPVWLPSKGTLSLDEEKPDIHSGIPDLWPEPYRKHFGLNTSGTSGLLT